jgi:outer membrane protein assembly factor BamD (BamD/ComL family)
MDQTLTGSDSLSPAIPRARRTGWKWPLIGVAAWVFAMVVLQVVSNSRLAYHQRAAQALKQATLIYVEQIGADQQEQKLRRARTAYEAVAAEFPNTEAGQVARFYSIRISYRLKEWDKAENDIDAFIAQGDDPDDYIVRAMEIRYQIYQARGESEKAAEYFREVIEADLAR